MLSHAVLNIFELKVYCRLFKTICSMHGHCRTIYRLGNLSLSYNSSFLHLIQTAVIILIILSPQMLC